MSAAQTLFNALYTVATGNLIQAQDIDQIVNLLKATPNYLSLTPCDPVTLTQVHAAAPPASGTMTWWAGSYVLNLAGDVNVNNGVARLHLGGSLFPGGLAGIVGSIAEASQPLVAMMTVTSAAATTNFDVRFFRPTDNTLVTSTLVRYDVIALGF